MQVREIACDESGYEGEKLVGGVTDVFAHAGVHLPVEDAAGCITELRARIRSPAQEYKANHLLREKHRRALEWLLSPRGPLHGRARVQLLDKTFLLVATVTDRLLTDRSVARELHRAGREALRSEHWAAFLTAANDVLRASARPDARPDPGALPRALDVLRGGAAAELDDLLGLLHPAGARLAEQQAAPLLDPLVPAVVRTVAHWSDAGRVPVRIVHDRQTTLTDERIATIRKLCGPPLIGVRLVGSREDPRIQLADFLAGVARKAASDALADRADRELAALLQPYVDPGSLWADEGSWALLGPNSLPTDPNR